EHDDFRTGVPARTLALGAGEFLRVELRTRVARDTGEPDAKRDEAPHARESASPTDVGRAAHPQAVRRSIDIEAAFERVIRQLRAIRRRWEVARLPEVAVSAGATSPGARVLDRIHTYMLGLASIDRATNAFVTKG